MIHLFDFLPWESDLNWLKSFVAVVAFCYEAAAQAQYPPAPVVEMFMGHDRPGHFRPNRVPDWMPLGGGDRFAQPGVWVWSPKVNQWFTLPYSPEPYSLGNSIATEYDAAYGWAMTPKVYYRDYGYCGTPTSGLFMTVLLTCPSDDGRVFLSEYDRILGDPSFLYDWRFSGLWPSPLWFDWSLGGPLSEPIIWLRIGEMPSAEWSCIGINL